MSTKPASKTAKPARAVVPPVTRFVPGEVDALPGDIELNVGRPTLPVTVRNTGDRPIQVGSHYHFFETNDALDFDRAPTRGFRLNIPAGTAVRFEPGQSRDIELVALAGDRLVYGFAGRIMGPLDVAKPKGGAKAQVLPATGARKNGASTQKKSPRSAR